MLIIIIYKSNKYEDNILNILCSDNYIIRIIIISKIYNKITN